MEKIVAVILAFIQSILVFFGATGGNGGRWKLDGVPCYEKGIVSTDVYDTGSGLVPDKDGPTETDGKMQLVSGTTKSEYDAYCTTLTESGFENVYSNELGGVSSNAFRKDGKFYYTYYGNRTGEVRIIEDNAAKDFENFGYTYSEKNDATVYQFQLPYTDYGEKNDVTKYSTNGMMYIIRLADNSLVVIDGGEKLEAADKNIDECFNFMKKITGTKQKKKVKIALWYGTHAHGDHYQFFYKLLGFYRKNIKLERVMFNYPSSSVIEHSKTVDSFRKRIAKYYKNVKYLVPHTGMSFSIANLNVDVLYTHEDAVSALDGSTPIVNPNDGSTVCRLSANSKSFLVTGDLGLLGEKKMTALHGEKIFKTDILQASHHLYNSNPVMYENARAQWVFCPISKGRAQHGTAGYLSAKKYYTESQLLFGDEAVYSIMLDDSLQMKSEKLDIVGYDGSKLNATMRA